MANLGRTCHVSSAVKMLAPLSDPLSINVRQAPKSTKRSQRVRSARREVVAAH